MTAHHFIAFLPRVGDVDDVAGGQLEPPNARVLGCGRNFEIRTRGEMRWQSERTSVARQHAPATRPRLVEHERAQPFHPAAAEGTGVSILL